MRSAVRWTAAGLLFGLLLASILRHGPLTLAAPATPLSHSEPAEQSSVPYLLFLREVSSRVPRGSSIVVLDATGEIGYMLAIGQLPEQIVMHPSVLIPGAPGAPPDWVARFGGDFRDPRFTLAARLEAGALYARAR